MSLSLTNVTSIKCWIFPSIQPKNTCPAIVIAMSGSAYCLMTVWVTPSLPQRMSASLATGIVTNGMRTGTDSPENIILLISEEVNKTSVLKFVYKTSHFSWWFCFKTKNILFNRFCLDIFATGHIELNPKMVFLTSHLNEATCGPLPADCRWFTGGVVLSTTDSRTNSQRIFRITITAWYLFDMAWVVYIECD